MDFDKTSSISKTFGEFILERRKEDSNLTKEQKEWIHRFKCFIKNYSGELKRLKVNDPNYRFNDEREWRLIPEKSVLKGVPFSILKTEYSKDKDKYYAKISKVRFPLEPSDISYIIVESTWEIPSMINLLRTN